MYLPASLIQVHHTGTQVLDHPGLSLHSGVRGGGGGGGGSVEEGGVGVVEVGYHKRDSMQTHMLVIFVMLIFKAQIKWGYLTIIALKLAFVRYPCCTTHLMFRPP